MRKAEFNEIKEKYSQERMRFRGIKKGDLVWEVVSRGIDCDFHPAVVKDVNVDETYVDVIDVSSQNEEKRYMDFTTESELVKLWGMSEAVIKEEYETYGETIRQYLN